MPQDKIDNVASFLLFVTGAAGMTAPQMLEIADKVVLFGFHVISAMSVSMIVVINRKKFIAEIKSWFKK
jgi:hypothetical protein